MSEKSIFLKERVLWFVLLCFVWLITIGCSQSEELIITDPGPAECQNAVQVEVFGDLNGNGAREENEPLLPDVLIGMLAAGASPEEALQYRTSERGRAYFPGFELEDCSPEGYQVLFLRQVSGYAFPEDPVVDLVDFNPNRDVVAFGLVPE